jgi:hypothetical protein
MSRIMPESQAGEQQMSRAAQVEEDRLTVCGINVYLAHQ